LRRTTGFGPRRLSRELKEKDGIRLSERTIWKIIRNRSRVSLVDGDKHPLSLVRVEEPAGVLA
jgi:hypothetical protein